MLVALSDITFGESRAKGAVFLERRFRAHVMWRHRLCWDSRFTAPARPADVVTLFLVLDGYLEHGGRVARGRQAVILTEREFERVAAGSATFRAWGDPLVTMDVTIPRALARGPVGLAHGPRQVGDDTWVQFESLVEALAVDEPLERWGRVVLDALAADGIFDPTITAGIDEPEPETFSRLWRVIAPLYGEFATSASASEIAARAGRSLRQLNRDLKQMAAAFGLGSGFREAAYLLRLRNAILLLSAPEVTAAEVARRVGYGTVDALARALRDAGLPPPSTIQQAVRYRQPHG